MSIIENINIAQTSDLPYLVFKVNGVLYAVNGEIINSIFVLAQPVTAVPMVESHVRGIINVRGEVMPLLELRTLFGLPTMKEECAQFQEMIEMRKKDHLDWVEAFRNSIENKKPFGLSLDPHQCKFGKWYDKFETKNNAVDHYMRKIDEPHAQLHQCAAEALACAEGDVDCNNVALARAYATLEPLLHLMDQVGDVYQQNCKQMVIILQRENVQIGVVVDEVMEVTDIDEVFSLNNMINSHRSQYVYGVGTIKDYDKEILMLDVDAIVLSNSSANSLAIS